MHSSTINVKAEERHFDLPPASLLTIPASVREPLPPRRSPVMVVVTQKARSYLTSDYPVASGGEREDL